MSYFRITLMRSGIGMPKRTQGVLKALGLRKRMKTVFYPVYRSTDATRGISPLSDQNLAGGLMMVEEILLTTILLGWVFYRFASQDEERQELLDPGIVQRTVGRSRLHCVVLDLHVVTVGDLRDATDRGDRW